MMTVDNQSGRMPGVETSVPGTGVPDEGEVVETVDRHQARLRDICRQLEEVADSLPLDVDPSLCMRLARTMLPALRASHEYRERHFWALARKVLEGQGSPDAVIDRLRCEYRENDLLAEEIAEELSQWGACAQPKSAETVGYMLRGFFLSLTRHLDMERVVLIEPVKSRLSRPAADEYPEP